MFTSHTSIKDISTVSICLLCHYFRKASVDTRCLSPSVQGPATSANPPPPPPPPTLTPSFPPSLYFICSFYSPFKRYLLVGLCFICQPPPVFCPAPLCQQCLWSAVQKRQPDYCALPAFIYICFLWSCNSVIRVNVYIDSYRTAMTFLFLWLFVSDKYTAAQSDIAVLVLFLGHYKSYTMVWFISMIRMKSAWNYREHILSWPMSQPLRWMRRDLWPVQQPLIQGQSRGYGFTFGKQPCRPSRQTVNYI